MAKDNSYRPNVYRTRGGNDLVVAASGTLQIAGGSIGVATSTSGGSITVNSGGSLSLATGSKFTTPINTATQGLTLTGAKSGLTVVSQVASLRHKLPNSTGNAGVSYRFVLGTGGLAATSAAGLEVKQVLGDKIVGAGLSAATNKFLGLTGATDAAGDFVEVINGGSGSWYVVGVRGGWALTSAT